MSGVDRITMAKPPEDLAFYGTVEPTAGYQITLPVRARRELDLETREPLFVFGCPSRKQMLLARGPTSAPDLFEKLSGMVAAEAEGGEAPDASNGRGGSAS